MSNLQRTESYFGNSTVFAARIARTKKQILKANKCKNSNANATAARLNHVEGRCMWRTAESKTKKQKEKNDKKKWRTKKKRNLFLNRSQVWRASEMARGCEKNVSCDKAGKNLRGGCVEKMHGKWK